MKKQSSYNIFWDGNVLITTVVGIINVGNTRRVFNQLKLEVPKLDGAPWANLIDVQKWGLSAVDINDTLAELELWVREHGRSHLVFVIGNEYAEIKKFVLKQYLGNNLQNDNVMIVDTEAEAIAWLGQYGFHLTSNNKHSASLSNLK